jgi:hypothetical protein
VTVGLVACDEPIFFFSIVESVGKPKFHRPRKPTSAESVDPSASTRYRPVSCCTCARTEAGGEEPMLGVAADLEFTNRLRRVHGLICLA